MLDNWYFVLSSIISIVIVILFIVSSKKHSQSSSPLTTSNFINANSPYITDIVLVSNTSNPQIPCPPGYFRLPIYDSKGNYIASYNGLSNSPNVQVCYKSTSQISSSDSVLTDLRFNSIQSYSGGIVDSTERCCNTDGSEKC